MRKSVEDAWDWPGFHVKLCKDDNLVSSDKLCITETTFYIFTRVSAVQLELKLLFTRNSLGKLVGFLYCSFYQGSPLSILPDFSPWLVLPGSYQLLLFSRFLRVLFSQSFLHCFIFMFTSGFRLLLSSVWLHLLFYTRGFSYVLFTRLSTVALFTWVFSIAILPGIFLPGFLTLLFLPGFLHCCFARVSPLLF
jgi:hypothetical protein